MIENGKTTTRKAAPDQPAKRLVIRNDDLDLKTFTLVLTSTAPLLQHRPPDLTDKAKLTDAEMFEQAIYHCHGWTEADPRYGHPVGAFSRALASAARFHKASKLHGKD